MALTELEITQLNNMNAAAQRAGLGDLVGIIRKISVTVARASFTDGGGASGTYAFTESIPVGATFLYSAITAVTGFTGDTSAVAILGDGTDTDRYLTGTPNVFATAAGGVDAGSPSGVRYHSTAKTPVLTVTSATDFTNVVAGSVSINMYYLL